VKKVKDPKSRDRYVVPAVEQAARLLFCLADAESSHLSLTEICDRADMHKSHTFAILHTLQKFGLAQRNVAGSGYSLGPGLIALSRKVLDDFNLPRIAEPILEELAKEARSTATLGLIVEKHLVIAAKYEDRRDIGVATVRIGRRWPLSHGAEGKAIASFLSEEKLNELLQEDELYFHGKPEKLDKKRLRKEITECRKFGYALDLAEINQKFNAVAAPVLGPDGTPIGDINIIGILFAEEARRLGPMVAEAGKTLSRQLGARVN
jgi:IclR family transcriptional regulator, acetate operon repressor